MYAASSTFKMGIFPAVNKGKKGNIFAHVEKKRHFLCSVQVNLSKEFFLMENGRLAQSKGRAVHNP
ncbi:hypothetical protein EK904_006376 [Melospiza melodia maxima]|nr:hypothetical protein EK904_006376 [Melospiza melodia maxima]